MTPVASGLTGFIIVILLIVVRVPVGIAMGVVGMIGLLVVGDEALYTYLMGSLPFENSASYTLSVVPLFIAMGVFAGRAGLTQQLYDVANAYLGGLRGGLAVATIGACAGFGAICGSAMATTATMARVAIPQMQRFGYDMRLAAATVAAGGTLGILIPPSIILIIYALLTEQSIGQLFVAAIIPGAIGTVLYMIAIIVTVRFRPNWAPPSLPIPAKEKARTLVAALPVIAMFVLVIGGIYSGLFTTNEAAAVGALAGLAFCIIMPAGRKKLWGGLPETAATTASIFLILIASGLFNAFLEVTDMPTVIVGWIADLDPGPLAFLLILSVFYIVMGMFMDELALILLTLPVVFPMIQHLGIDPIWFGIYVVTIVEVGLITPPVGLNLFVVRGVSGIPVGQISVGAIPFIAVDLVRICLMIAFPAIVTWLPGLM